MFKLKLFSFCILLMFLVAISACNKIDNFDDCILDSVKNEKTQVAVAHAYEACRSKFPRSKRESFLLTREQIGKIDTNSSIRNGYLSGDLYHSNEGIVIAEIKFAVGPQISDEDARRIESDSKFKEEFKNKFVRYYVLNEDMKPYAQNSLYLKVDAQRENHFVWFIESARGYKISK